MQKQKAFDRRVYREEALSDYRITKESLEYYAEEFPASNIADLIHHFPSDLLCSLAHRYEGKVVSFPSIKKIWVKFRNKAIKRELDQDRSVENRKKLAEIFGISVDNLNKIYWRTSHRAQSKEKYHKRKAERKNENNTRKSERIAQ